MSFPRVAILLGTFVLTACVQYSYTSEETSALQTALLTPTSASCIALPGSFTIYKRGCERREASALPIGFYYLSLLIDPPTTGWSVFQAHLHTQMHTLVRLRSGEVVLNKSFPISALRQRPRNLSASDGQRLYYGAGNDGLMGAPQVIDMHECSANLVYSPDPQADLSQEYPSTLFLVPIQTDCEIIVCISHPDRNLRGVTASIALYHQAWP